MKHILLIFLFTFLILHSSIANAIEVGGHISEDTTWSPENNPYQVVENLYVDEGVTLTLLPGTEVEVASTSLTSLNDYDQKFWLPNNVAKMIWVDGCIIAVGTQPDSIRFTRMNDEEDDFWGCIYFSANAEMPIFKHCRFEYSAGMGIWVGHTANMVLTAVNGQISVDKCYFYCNTGGVAITSYPLIRAEVINSTFINNPFHDNFGQNYWGGGGCSFNNTDSLLKPVLLANNTASYYDFSAREGCFTHNKINRGNLKLNDDRVESFIYDNDIEYGKIRVWGDDGNSGFYIKKNRIMSNGVGNGIEGHETYAEISDNYLEGCGVEGPFQVELIGKIKNNIIKNNSWNAIRGRFEEMSTNIYLNCNMASSVIGSSEIFNSNVIINNSELCNLLADTPIIENNIILRNDLSDMEIMNNPVFRNNIIDFPLNPPIVDGGGNIIVDSLQAQLIFEDIENGDFHLAEGSIAIDAGFDTLGYYYPFDIDNSIRVWDGDGDGNAVIDIGAYEYGAPQLGKIAGYITETDTGEPVDYVLIKADNEPGEFTFADSSGYFEIQLPEGTYDLYTERVFYEDNIIYTVTVNNEETTEIEFNMTSTFPHVGIDEEELIIHNSTLKISNYPNPFNPSTTISFHLTTEYTEDTEIEIYNIKGQKVNTFVCHPEPVEGRQTQSVTWHGTDKHNNHVSSGVYFAILKTGNKILASRKMLLLK